MKDFVGKNNSEFCVTKPLAASEYLDKNVNKIVKEDGLEVDVTIPINTFIMGDIIDVTVCLAISPSYFVIQTNSSVLELEQLSIDMFSFYEEHILELDQKCRIYEEFLSIFQKFKPP